MSHRDSKDNQEDVVEMKKAIATGSAKDAAAVSSGELNGKPHNVITLLKSSFGIEF